MRHLKPVVFASTIENGHVSAQPCQFDIDKHVRVGPWSQIRSFSDDPITRPHRCLLRHEKNLQSIVTGPLSSANFFDGTLSLLSILDTSKVPTCPRRDASAAYQ